MVAPKNAQILMLPGLASDHRLFSAQRTEYPGMIVPEWPDISGKSKATDLPKEFVNNWLLGEKPLLDIEQPYFLGGASTGGIIALEMAFELANTEHPPAGVFLIGSVRCWDDVPEWFSSWLAWSRRLPSWYSRRSLINKVVQSPSKEEAFDSEGRRLIRTMAQDTAWTQLQRSVEILVSWRRDKVDTARASFPVHQIHGRKDTVLPHPSTSVSTLLTLGGHWICVTHPQAINNWMAAIMADSAIRKPRPK